MEPETMMINKVEYVRKDSVVNEVFEFTGEKTVASVAIGKNMIVRTRNAGLLVGTVELADETGIVLINSRRIHYHRPKNKKMSWYEGLAESGIDENSKVSCSVKRRVVIEDYECTEFSKQEYYKSIMELIPNAQS